METAKIAERMLEEWLTPPKCNKDFTRPTEDDKHSIRTAIAESQGRVAGKIVDLVENELKRFE